MGIAVLSMIPALLALFMPRNLPSTIRTWLLAAVVGFLFVWLLSYLPAITAQGAIEVNVPWVPELGLTLAIYLDGLALLFSLIITGAGTAIILYTGYYFDDPLEAGRFYALLLAFMSAMLALVLAGNVLTLFIAWELTSILSFLLISFDGEKAEARKGALQALIITGGGGLALLVGLMLLGTAADTTQISEILTNDTLRDHPWYTGFTVLILIGCFSKSAQFPLHFWLPGAMSAPTPASAYLHSATMVKAGIYLMARLAPALGDTALWENTLLVVGLVTLAMGATFALRQRDLKGALAYSTISSLGAMTALIALPHGDGIKALLVGVLAHSLYKATLFLMVGAVDHAAGTRSLDKLGGLRAAMPGWMWITAIAALSMAGLPPLLGFVAKEALLEAMLISPIALIIVVYSAIMSVALALILIYDIFLGASRGVDLAHLHISPAPMLAGPAALAALSVAAGLLLDLTVKPLLAPYLHAEIHLALFSGFNTSLLLSGVALAGGYGVFATRAVWRRWMLPALPEGTMMYGALVNGVERAGDLVLKTQGGKIRYYLIVILGAASVLMATAGLSHIIGQTPDFSLSGGADIFKLVLLGIALGAMLASILFKRHLTAALCLGLAGYCVGGVFLLEPAPDVALVQFLVETLGTVLLIIMLAKISAPARQRAIDNLWSSSRKGVARDIAISTLVGAGMTLFCLAAVMNRPFAQTITLWHMEHALPEIGIPDIVGAIVTDFRGMDTVIEITVFGMAALGVMALLLQKKEFVPAIYRPAETIRNYAWRVVRVKSADAAHPEDEENHHEELPIGSQFSTPMTRTVALMALPFALLLALAQLIYGGDGPGDGFTAGVTSGIGVSVWYIVFGYAEARQRLAWLHPRMLIGSGILLVVLNGAIPMLFGYPFLAHIPFEFIPLPANIHISTTFLFETGIFLTVFGSSSLVLSAIAYPGELEA